MPLFLPFLVITCLPMQFVLTDLEWNVEHDANNDKNFIYKNALFSYFTIQKQKNWIEKENMPRFCLFVFVFVTPKKQKQWNVGYHHKYDNKYWTHIILTL